MHPRVLWDICFGLGRATLLGYGGGPSIIPLYEVEAVQNYQWMSKEEFGQALAFGNALPGPIATKLTTYIGYKVAGVPGALAALLGTVGPTAVLMIVLYALLTRFKDSPVVGGMVKGIRPVVFVMLAMMAADFFPYAVGAGWVPLVLALGYWVSVQFFGLSPLYGVVAALAVGGLFLRH